jgi:1,4-dihydroxy-2-naphthoyl-CoA hydrolase
LVSRISGISHFHVPMPFSDGCTVHSPDTDAAGVVFFPNSLALWQAYEQARAAAGMDVGAIFQITPGDRPRVPQRGRLPTTAQGGRSGPRAPDPLRLTEVSFAIDHELTKLGPVEKRATRLRTEHISILVQTQERTPLPAALAAWIAQG